MLTSCEDHMHDNSNGPNIDTPCIILMIHHFGSHEAGTSNESLGHLILLQVLGDTKITDINLPRTIHEYIPALNISMNLIVLMKIVQCAEHILQYSCDNFLIFDAFWKVSLEDVLYAASVEEGHDHPEVTVILKRRIVTDNTLMPVGRHDFNFLPYVIHVSISKHLHIYNFNRHFISIVLIALASAGGFPDHAVGATADGHVQLIVFRLSRPIFVKTFHY